MKNLIFINGTMGVGKTTTGKELQKLLPHCVFFDGDWCWNSSPFIVTENTKHMVLENITFLINNFLACPDYKNIVFCWVMHEKSIIDEILKSITYKNFAQKTFTLTCIENVLTKRLKRDIKLGTRSKDILAKSISRLGCYSVLETIKIDVSHISAREAAQQIFAQI